MNKVYIFVSAFIIVGINAAQSAQTISPQHANSPYHAFVSETVGALRNRANVLAFARCKLSCSFSSVPVAEVGGEPLLTPLLIDRDQTNQGRCITYCRNMFEFRNNQEAGRSTR